MNDLVLQYNKVKKDLETASLKKAGLEARLETTTKTKQALEKEILELSGAKTIEEAQLKVAKLEERIETKLRDAQNLLVTLDNE